MFRFYRYIILLLVLIACKEEMPQTSEGVYIAKADGQARFHVNGKPYQIKGLSGSAYLSKAAAIGANTIRTYDTIGLGAVLDSAHKNGLMVVAGIWLPKSQVPWLYHYEEQYLKLGSELAKLGRKYREHPALLSWCLGNELVYYDLFDWKFARAYNVLLDSLRQGDPQHPIGTAFANYGKRSILNYSLKIRDLDYMLINTFGRLRKLDEDRKALNWFWPKPFLIGEFGESGPWETEWTSWGVPIEPKSSAKAKILAERFALLPEDNPDYLGALIFYWGWRQEQTHTWFNTFSEKGERNAMYYFLQKQYSGKEEGGFPIIDTLLLNGSQDFKQFYFQTGEEQFAQARFHSGFEGDSLEVSWSIRAEDWYFLKADTPPPLPDLIIDNQVQSIRFICPPKPGPYRLFLKISDQRGNFATANLPFYVVQ